VVGTTPNNQTGPDFQALIIDTVLYALGSVSTVHKACFSRLMQQLIRFKRWSSMSVRSDRNALFYFVLISRNEVKLPKSFRSPTGALPS
jgi:hypothetical protein